MSIPFSASAIWGATIGRTSSNVFAAAWMDAMSTSFVVSIRENVSATEGTRRVSSPERTRAASVANAFLFGSRRASVCAASLALTVRER